MIRIIKSKPNIILQLIHQYLQTNVSYNLYCTSITFCEHLGSHNAFSAKHTCNIGSVFFEGPEDDPVKVETCRPVYILFNVYEINCCVID